jgi:hypothetical protein
VYGKCNYHDDLLEGGPGREHEKYRGVGVKMKYNRGSQFSFPRIWSREEKGGLKVKTRRQCIYILNPINLCVVTLPSFSSL